jgi:hypothetical protein
VHDLSARLGIHPQAAPHPWESSCFPLPFSLSDQISGSTLPNQNGPKHRKVPASHISRTTKDKTRSVCTCDISRDLSLSLSQSHSLARSLPRPTSQPTGPVENQADSLRVKKERCRCRCRTVLAHPSVVCVCVCVSSGVRATTLAHTATCRAWPSKDFSPASSGVLGDTAPRGLGAARPPRKRDRPCHPDEIFLSFFVSLR